MTTKIHLHVPADAKNLDAAIEGLDSIGIEHEVIRNGDSYFEWGERISADPDDDDTEHVVVEVTGDHANAAYHHISQHGVLVDASLAEDWSSRITWGLGEEPEGWFKRYGDRIAL